MRVIKASVLGYCMGVRRAVEIAVRESPAYTIGPLIHNPQVLEELKSQGVEALDEANLPADLTGKRVIIRAHGIPPELEAALEARGAELRDATCPRVKASQLMAKRMRGRHIFLAGERLHGEIIGIRGYAGECAVVGDRLEAEAAAKTLFDALGEEAAQQADVVLIGQTTISPEEYREIGQGIGLYFPKLEIMNTICGATRDRQEALRALCGQVDVIVVAGGRGSANTQRLLSIALAQGKPAWLLELAEEIPQEIGAYRTVGLCAGASTPDSVINEIEESLAGL